MSKKPAVPFPVDTTPQQTEKESASLFSFLDDIEHQILDQQAVVKMFESFFVLSAPADSTLNWCIKQAWDGLRVTAERLHEDQQLTSETVERLWQAIKESERS